LHPAPIPRIVDAVDRCIDMDSSPITLPPVRPAAVAGLFYPGASAALARELDDALARARHVSHAPPKALIVPHAGYIYSGSLAAGAYACLRPSSAMITRVVILGPCHRVPLAGLAVPSARAFATPLGLVPLDLPTTRAIAQLPQVAYSDAAHAREHALEVQLPFLQRVLGRFSIVPLAVGNATADDVAEVLERVWGGPETLIVISSDLSHYHGYDEARRRDEATARAILGFDTTIDHEQACGATPIAGLLTVAKRRGLVPQLLGLCNSGDTAGDRQRVVGYAAFAFHEADDRDDASDETQGRTLLNLARGAIHEALGGPALPPIAARWLDVPGACFVTLRQEERLRGCVGSLMPRRRLRDDVITNARAAALSDPRFLPLANDELARTRVEVSVLAPPVRLSFTDRDALLAQLSPGVDGLIVTSGRRRATFLPQVWDILPDAATFVDELVRKTGLPPGTPLHSCRFERYRARKWSEPERGS
jgi:AmmeMemoRadiSam system protein B/AmmeMemoRadiSam system protein A